MSPTLVMTVLGLFFGVLIAVSIWYAGRIKSADDFALAGRTLGAGVLIGTLVAT